MATKEKTKGNIGENLAKKFLLKQGFVFVMENYQLRSGEIDLIFKDGREIVFVEVKTRSSSQFGEGIEAVNSLKLAKILKTAESFLLKKGLEEADFRIDVISIALDYKTRRARIKWFKRVEI